MSGLLWQAECAALAHEADFDGFRREARRHLARGTPPDALAFCVAPEALEDGAVPDPAPDPGLRLPASALPLLQQAVQHAEPTRFELMYRWLWRLQRSRAVAHDPLDADRQQLQRWAQAVCREQHKMKAFVRFRPIMEPGEPETLHVAWFDPAHHVLEAVAPFFVKRFAGMRFAILTPTRSLRWDGSALRWAGGVARADAPPADAGEALWLAYYAALFNPARLKLAAMRKEMPRRYWADLPEAVLISGLAQQAGARTQQMLARGGGDVQRRIPAHALAPLKAADGDNEPPL